MYTYIIYLATGYKVRDSPYPKHTPYRNPYGAPPAKPSTPVGAPCGGVFLNPSGGSADPMLPECPEQQVQQVRRLPIYQALQAGTQGCT